VIGHLWVISVSSPPFSNMSGCDNNSIQQLFNEPSTTENGAAVV
jgi:hypothetical protein